MLNGKSMTNRKASKSELCRPVLAAAGRETGSAWGTAIEAARPDPLARNAAGGCRDPSASLGTRAEDPDWSRAAASRFGSLELRRRSGMERLGGAGPLPRVAPSTVLFIRIDALAADGRPRLWLADPRRVEVTT